MDAQSARTGKGVVWLCIATLWMSGCFTGQPARVSIAQRIRFLPPTVPAPTSADLELPPEITPAIGPLTELVPVRSAPPRPRVAPQPSVDPGKAEKQREPGIAPEFTTQEAQAAKADAQRNLEAMEKNLSLSLGRQLNASQQDLVSKVRGFAENAREAMRSGDWVRAKVLSKKAQVLSEELAASL